MAEPTAYQPRFGYTHAIVNDLTAVEGARQLLQVLPLPPDAALLLRFEAQRHSARYSTAIEGNTLALEDIGEALAHSDRTGSRQLQEVRNYWQALEWLEQRLPDAVAKQVLGKGWGVTQRGADEIARIVFSERFIQALHAIIIPRGRGRRPQTSNYRTEECPVVDRATGLIEYGPPAPADVPGQMTALVDWRNSDAAAALPAPVRAGILAYQFVTIHPFADGNGRTARALATAELWFSGYRMRGFLSVEEEYFRDLTLYYASLQMGLPMNYYEGRNDPDLTPWLGYFMQTLAAAARRLKARALELHAAVPLGPNPWDELNRRQQQLLSRLAMKSQRPGEPPVFSPTELAEWFMVSRQTAQGWVHDWHSAGFVTPMATGGQRVRFWRLADEYEALLGDLPKSS